VLLGKLPADRLGEQARKVLTASTWALALGCFRSHQRSTLSSIQTLPVCSMIVRIKRFADTPISAAPYDGEISRRELSKCVIWNGAPMAFP
jgi:hypothetical protein